MTRPPVLLFDVFGTLVDWRGSLVDGARALSGPSDVDWPALVDDWRRAYQPALDRVIGGEQWRDLDTLHSATLDDVLARHGLPLPAEQRRELVLGWHRLRHWPDTRQGLELLRRGHITATLSNGHVALLVDLLRAGDLRVDAVLSAELAGSYKPDPRVYRRGAQLLGRPPEQAVLVAAHPDDLRGAAAAELGTALVRRPDEWGPGAGAPEAPDLPGLVVVDDLRQLPGALARSVQQR